MYIQAHTITYTLSTKNIGRHKRKRKHISIIYFCVKRKKLTRENNYIVAGKYTIRKSCNFKITCITSQNNILISARMFAIPLFLYFPGENRTKCETFCNEVFFYLEKLILEGPRFSCLSARIEPIFRHQ